MTLLVGRQEGHPACIKREQCVAGVVICMERGADLGALFLQPVKPRWPRICICIYMVRVRVRVRVSVTDRVTVRVCHDTFRTRSPMFDMLHK